MKLFTKSKADLQTPQEIEASVVIAHPPSSITDNEIQPGYHPVIIRPVVPITFEQAKLPVSKLIISNRIQEWMNYDRGFKNWLLTCVACHVENGRGESVCSIPDEWRSDVGEAVTIVNDDCVPGKEGLVYQAGVIRIMA